MIADASEYQQLVEWLTIKVAGYLNVPPDTIDIETPLADCGIDSVAAMALCVDLMNEFRWGRDLNRCVEPLSRYGGAARELLPRLRETRQKIVSQNKDWEKNEDRKREVLALDKVIAAVESDRNSPAVRSLEDFIRAPGPPK